MRQVKPVSDQQTTTLLLLPNTTRLEPVLNCETDARTALSRGLQEYLLQLTAQSIEFARDIRLVSVLHTWAEAEIPADYPGACVYSSDEHEYPAAARMTPNAVGAPRFENGQLLLQYGEVNYELTIEIYCNDPVERMAICKMVEDGLNPSEAQYGLTLQFPHYYNAIGTYELMRGTYTDSSETVQRRLRQATFKVAAACPVYRLTAPKKARADIRARITVSE